MTKFRELFEASPKRTKTYKELQSILEGSFDMEMELRTDDFEYQYKEVFLEWAEDADIDKPTLSDVAEWLIEHSAEMIASAVEVYFENIFEEPEELKKMEDEVGDLQAFIRRYKYEILDAAAESKYVHKTAKGYAKEIMKILKGK